MAIYSKGISSKFITKTCPEKEIFESILSLDNQNILELGCGDATLTKIIASTGKGRTVTAIEVDEIQHKKNIQHNDFNNISFKLAGGENIPSDDDQFDTVFMFKSMHHIPLEAMNKALGEIKRVLKKDGLVYISEPIFSGDFNEILRLFHDEKKVREAAFNCIKKSVDEGVFTISNEVFFNSPIVFDNFEQFKQRVIGVTHTNHQLEDELLEKVKKKFTAYFKNNGGRFLIPIRVNLLKVPVTP